MLAVAALFRKLSLYDVEPYLDTPGVHSGVGLHSDGFVNQVPKDLPAVEIQEAFSCMGTVLRTDIMLNSKVGLFSCQDTSCYSQTGCSGQEGFG